MRRVKCQYDVHRAAGRGDVGREAEVILHIARAGADIDFAFEFSKQHARVFAVDIDQHVESATMRHTDYDFFHARTASSLDDFIQKRDKALAAFKGKSFLANVLFVQVLLEFSSGSQPAQDVALFVGVELWATAHLLHPTLQPTFLFGGRNVRELSADASTVGVSQQGGDVAQGLLGVEQAVLKRESMSSAVRL